MDDTTQHEVELKRCAEDFIYFCENYIKISNPTRGLINFILHPYQKRYIKALQDNRFLITKKFRQGGFSSLNCAWATWNCIFSKDKSIMFVAKTDREITHGYAPIIDKIIQELPDWLKPKMGKNNEHQKHFEDTGCKIFLYDFKATRGKTIDYLFIEEAAFISDMEKYWIAIWPTISTGGHCYVTSTTNGTNNWFHNTYTNAEKLENSFKVFHCSYIEHPDYSDENWAANTKHALGSKGWRQEVLCEFVEEDKRTIEQKISDTVQYFDDMSAAEEFVNSLNESSPKKSRKKIDNVSIKCGVLKGLDWGLDVPYTEEPVAIPKTQKLIDVETAKPEVVHFKAMSKEEQKIFIEKESHKKIDKVDHPEWDEFSIKNTEDLADFWEYAAEVEPNFKPIKQYWYNAVEEQNKRMEEMENKANEFITPELLAMAGLMDRKEAKVCSLDSYARPDLKIIDKIKQSGRYPDCMKLSFYKGKLCINSVPTVIREEDLQDLYNGTLSLIGYDQAINSVVSVIQTKLDDLFKGVENAESLVEESLK